MSDKIQAAHRQRRAVVYVRQSTLRQIVAHPESTRRQYALRERAQQLGWAADAIDIVDEDLGQSGADARRRVGFRRLCEQVAHGRVGAIFVLELSRLARSSSDWHRLLDLCGVADVVLVDEQAVYDPADNNDRLLLGIKGTLSEAERGWILLRLRGARLSKARRGDYRLVAPAGYVWDRATARLRLDPDAEVQGAVRLVFARFRVEQSAFGVARYFIAHGLRLPALRADGSGVRWTAPRPSRILAMLHNPTYAGAYVYGRRVPRAAVVDGAIVRRSVRVPVAEWQIVHHDHHPAYLPWEEFVTNQQALTDNRAADATPARHGAPRAGAALLQGLVLCGRCGHRMHVAYGSRGQRGRYTCASPIHQGHATRVCWSIGARAIDAAVVARVLAAVTPDALALGLAVTEAATEEAAVLDRQWALRVERARYEATLAERRYKAVDPTHRTVAQTLEREWEVALQGVAQLERERAAVSAQAHLELTPADRARIAQLSRDVPAVWHASSTTIAQRKALLRTLVREVCLTPREGATGGTRIRILWQTGATTDLAIARQRPGPITPAAAAARIRALVAASTPASAIATALNDARLRTATGRAWTKADVHAYCHHHEIKWPQRLPSSLPRPERRADGAYSTRGVAVRLRVPHAMVLYWVKRGYLTSIEGGGRGTPRWYRLTPATLARLRQLRAGKTGRRRRTA